MLMLMPMTMAIWNAKMQIWKLLTLTVTLKFCVLSVRANPLLGLIDPKCVVEPNRDCPHEKVSFWLYTNETRDNPVLLDPLNLIPDDFEPKRPLRVLIHGYTGYRDFAPNSYIRPVLLDTDDVQVISIDYGPLVPLPCYFSGVQNLPLASKCLGHLLNNLVDQELVEHDDIHLIGFSLGAQVAGQTANYVKRKLKRITGLDPAKPMFITVGSEYKLDPDDAEFVDVIHTDVLGRGMLRSMGHADFYPNIGPHQPGCQLENPNDPGLCNHDRAPIYYAESIRRGKGFWGYHCPSWLHYLFNLCSDSGNDALMGYYVNKSAQGSYFLKTATSAPFALGLPSRDANDTAKDWQLSYYNIDDIDDENFEPQLRRAFLDGDDDEQLNDVEPRTKIIKQKTKK